MALLEDRKVGHGDAHLLRELGERQLPLDHHQIEIDFNRHDQSSDGQILILLKPDPDLKDPRNNEESKT